VRPIATGDFRNIAITPNNRVVAYPIEFLQANAKMPCLAGHPTMSFLNLASLWQ